MKVNKRLDKNILAYNSNLCIETKACFILSNELGTLCPEIGAASDIPASFLAFQTSELKSTNESVIFVHSPVLDIGDLGKISTSTADFSYNIVER